MPAVIPPNRHVPVVSESVNLATRDSDDGMTALHCGCEDDLVKSVRLWLAHPQCTQEIVKLRDDDGYTAEMIAALFDSHQVKN